MTLTLPPIAPTTPNSQYPLYPLLGILSTALGTGVAILFVPIDPYLAGVLLPSALAMAVGLATAPVIALRRSPKTIIRAEHLLVLAPIYWLLLDLLQGAYNLNLDRTAVISGFVAIGIFVGGVWSASLTRSWNLPTPVRHATHYALTPARLFRLVVIFFGLGIFRFAYPCQFNPIKMVYFLGQNRWAAPWTRGALGGWDAFLDHMAYFGYLLPTLTVLYALRRRSLDFQLAVAIGLTLIISLFLAQGGNRRVVGVMFGAALICWVLEQQRLNLRRLLLLVLSIGLLLGTMQLILEFRNVGLRSFWQSDRSLQYEYLHVDDNFLRLGQIIDLVPAQYSFVYEKQIVFTLVRPIPRVLWASKPTSPGFDLGAINGLKGVSLSSSVVGEWYLSFGWVGIFVGGWLYGRLAGMTSRLLLQPADASSLVYSLLAMALFVGTRSMLDLVLISYTLLAWIAVTLVLGRRQQ